MLGRNKKIPVKSVGVALLFLCHQLSAQNVNLQGITIDDAVKIALANNPVSKNADLKITGARLQKHSGFDLGTTEFNFRYGQINSAFNDKYFEIHQHLGSPITYIQKEKYLKENIKLTEAEQKLLVKQLLTEVKSSYINWKYQLNKMNLIKAESVFYDDLIKIAESQYEQKEIDLLKKLEIETRYADFQNQLFQMEQEYKMAANRVKQLLYVSYEIVPSDTTFELYEIQFHRIGEDKFIPSEHLNYYEERLNASKADLNLERSRFFPELYGGYFNQEIDHTKGFEGVTFGMAVPLWFFPQKTKVKEARINQEIAKNDLEYQKFNLDKTIENLKLQLDQLFVQISYFRENALVHSDVLEKTSTEKYMNEEMGYFDYIQNLNMVLKTRLDYLETVKQYNLTAIQLEYYVH